MRKADNKEEVLRLIDHGWEMGRYNPYRGRPRAWLQEAGMCKGGDTVEVPGAMFNSLLKSGAIIALPRREGDQYWLNRYGLSKKED